MNSRVVSSANCRARVQSYVVKLIWLWNITTLVFSPFHVYRGRIFKRPQCLYKAEKFLTVI